MTFLETQQEIIEKIRKENFGIGIDTDDEIIKNYIVISNQRQQRLLELISKRLYSENIHFVYELIQNAEDNEYLAEITPELNFIVDTSVIIVHNNEKGFSRDDVYAICDIADSKKRKSEGHIGDKGIGFKSVFKITDEPHIFSNGFQFKFKYKDVNDPLGFVVPHWVKEIPDGIKGNWTNIYLPLNDSKTAEKLKFDEIDPEFILFLNKINKVQIFNKESNAQNVIKKEILDDIIIVSHSDNEDKWKLAYEYFFIPEAVADDKRREIEKTIIALAFPLKANGEAITSTEQKVFTYLPIRKYGFRFIIQADFELTSSREDLEKDFEWNLWLRDNLATAFVNAIEILKMDEAMQYSFYNIIPLPKHIADPFFHPVVDQIKEKLLQTSFIVNDWGEFSKPTGLFWTDDGEIREIVSNSLIREEFGKNFINKSVNINKAVLDFLDIEKFGIDKLILCLRNDSWVADQSDSWLLQLYDYLKRKLPDEKINEIRNLRIIRLQDESLVSINDMAIFFPMNFGKRYGFEHELGFIKKTTFETEDETKKESIIQFLRRMGVKPLTPAEIIEDHILPIYKNHDEYSIQSIDSVILVGYIRYIKDNLDIYFSDRGKWKGDQLKKSLLLRTSDKNASQYNYPENLYLPSSMGNRFDLETLFAGISVRYVDEYYLDIDRHDISSFETKIEDLKKNFEGMTKTWLKKNKKLVKNWKDEIAIIEEEKAQIIQNNNSKIQDEINSWKNFLVIIGVNEGPKVVKHRGSPTSEDKEYWNYNFRDSTNPVDDEIEDWRFSPEFKGIFDFNCNNDPKLEHEAQRNKYNLLLKILDELWEDKYSKYLEMTYKYFYYNKKTKPFESTFKREISEWEVPSTYGDFLSPQILFLKTDEIYGLFGDEIAYLEVDIKSEKFQEFLKIQTEIDTMTLLEGLEYLRAGPPVKKEIYERIYHTLYKESGKSEQNEIKSFFEDTPAIYIPNSKEEFFTRNEVFWENQSNLFGDGWGYLKDHYPKLKSFFVGMLGVKEKPSAQDYAELLQNCADKGCVDKKDRNKILKIYRTLNDFLNPKNNEYSLLEEDWWKEFISKPIFLTENNEFLNSHDDIFIPDNTELYNVFRENPGIHFLWYEQDFYPKIEHFIKATGIRFLSNSVVTQLAERDNPVINEKFTEQIRLFTPYIERFLYKSNNDDFERLNKEGIFSKLKEITVYNVDRLVVKFILSETIFKCGPRNLNLHDGDLYYVGSEIENFDAIALELAKLFNLRDDFSDFLIILFEKGSVDKIENYLRNREIGNLPTQELFDYSYESAGECDNVEVEGYELNVVEDEILDRGTQEVKEDVSMLDRSVDPLSDNAEITHENEISSINNSSSFTTVQKTPLNHSNKQSPQIATLNGNNPSRDQHDPSNIEYYSNDLGVSPKKTDWVAECQPENVPIRVDRYKNSSTSHSPVPLSMQDDQDPILASNNSNDEGESDRLSQADKKNIGNWGEKYAYHYLIETFANKYPDAHYAEINDISVFSQDGENIAEICWLNKNGEKGIGHDIEVTENGLKECIEVKSTKTATKDWFDITRAQWEYAKAMGENFKIYRVYNAGTHTARINIIKNPYKFWQNGHITAYHIRIKI